MLPLGFGARSAGPAGGGCSFRTVRAPLAGRAATAGVLGRGTDGPAAVVCLGDRPATPRRGSACAADEATNA